MTTRKRRKTPDREKNGEEENLGAKSGKGGFGGQTMKPAEPKKKKRGKGRNGRPKAPVGAERATLTANQRIILKLKTQDGGGRGPSPTAPCFREKMKQQKLKTLRLPTCSGLSFISLKKRGSNSKQKRKRGERQTTLVPICPVPLRTDTRGTGWDYVSRTVQHRKRGGRGGGGEKRP